MRTRTNYAMPRRVSRLVNDDLHSMFDWNTKNFSSNESTLPSVNIKENANQYVVEVAAPGMSKTDFEVEVHNNVLTIKSNRQESSENNDDNFHRKEFSYSNFQRTFNLNKDVVDDASVDAKYNSGILTVFIGKKEEAKEKPARLIEIAG